MHPNQITQWKRQLNEQAADVFEGGKPTEVPVDIKTLHAKTGQLPLENDFLESLVRVKPYHLPLLNIERTNQVWALDTTYIPMAKEYVYHTAVVDGVSRKVLASKVAITLEATHAVEVLREAFNRHGTPEIVNTDQGSQ